jgi:hypothetical protein
MIKMNSKAFCTKYVGVGWIRIYIWKTKEKVLLCPCEKSHCHQGITSITQLMNYQQDYMGIMLTLQ